MRFFDRSAVLGGTAFQSLNDFLLITANGRELTRIIISYSRFICSLSAIVPGTKDEGGPIRGDTPCSWLRLYALKFGIWVSLDPEEEMIHRLRRLHRSNELRFASTLGIWQRKVSPVSPCQPLLESA